MKWRGLVWDDTVCAGGTMSEIWRIGPLMARLQQLLRRMQTNGGIIYRISTRQCSRHNIASKSTHLIGDNGVRDT